MQWLPSENKLSKAQNIVIDSLSSVEKGLICGYPGTGKSVVLTYFAIQHSDDACILTFTHALVDCIKDGLKKIDYSSIPVRTIHSFVFRPKHYKYLLVDEVQDLPKTINNVDVLQCLRSNCDHLIFAGDDSQSIYDQCVPFQEIKSGVSNEARHELLVVHRMTEQMLGLLRKLFPNRCLKAKTAKQQDDVDIQMKFAKNLDLMYQWTYKQATDYAQSGLPVVILFPSHQKIEEFRSALFPDAPELNPPDFSKKQTPEKRAILDRFNMAMAQKGEKIRCLGHGAGNLEECDGAAVVYLMTCHSAKGLDFETALIPGFTDIGSQNMLYVALSRARRDLILVEVEQNKEKPICQQLASLEFVKQGIADPATFAEDDDGLYGF